MSISALSSTSAASALSFLSRLSSTNSISSKNNASSAEGVRPPPPPDGGGFADAIAEALKSIGITDTDAASDSASTSASTGADTSDAADSGDVAAALGSFLQSLMGALHAQHSDGAQEPPPYGEQQGAGGPGKLESDLQSLLAKLSADPAANSDDSDAVDQLESSFANLLDKLGASATDSTDSTDSAASTTSASDATTKLAAFLQALSTKVGGNGSSGNLVNTKV